MQYYIYVNMHLLCLEWHFFIPFKETVIFFFWQEVSQKVSLWKLIFTLEYFKNKSIIENTIYFSGIVDLAGDIQCV